MIINKLLTNCVLYNASQNGLTCVLFTLFFTGCATNPGSSANIQNSIEIKMHSAQSLVIEDYSQSSAKINTLEAKQLPVTTVERIHNLPKNSPDNVNHLVDIIETDVDEQTTTRFFIKDQENSPENDLWERIRLGFKLDHSHPGIRHDLKWYAEHQAYLDRVVDRAQPYLFFIVSEAEQRGIPAEIALLPIVESAFQPFAYSHGRAAGIWQFIPGTGKMFGLKQNWWYDGRRDIYASTQAAMTYLKKLNKQFNNDWLLALAAYNSGPGTVKRAINKNKRTNRPIDFWSLQLPKETRGYVPKLLAISKIVANPSKYNVALKSISDTPFLERVFFDGQIDLALAAELAGISQDDIYRYNPGFNRWATDPNGPNYLLVPIENAKQFNKKLASLPPEKRTRWEKHRIRSGENLGQIARRYRTTPSVIKQVNKLRGHNIRAGRDLIIPVAVKHFSAYTQTADQRKKNIQNTIRKGKKTIYRVTSGDTLWDLSRKYGVGVRQLAKWNAMAPTDPLKNGQKLTIWSNTSTFAKKSKRTNYSAPRAAPPSDEITRKINYVVRKGDSLARIARKFRVSISQLRLWNRLPKNKYLYPGQQIRLFVDITRQSG
ncbi:MAG: LysM peptidoglycan-binding domain-containing protein [Gammaproteobacteria bacterium]|nr:LysM peptidoglycan-binding domain-containing protein [Gammaproteobacteria bacterium]